MKIIEKYEEQGENKIVTVVSANYIGDFAIRLVFSNRHEILVDFKPFLEQASHPAIRRYLDETEFKKFKIVDGNLDWNDFDLCFPIEDLYNNSIIKPVKAIL